MLVGGVVAAAFGTDAPPSIAASVAVRGGEIVAREAPGDEQAGIAVLRGADRVRLLGERDGWSEILLSDGRRAWVPSADLTRAAEPARSEATAAPEPEPTPIPTATAAEPSVDALAAEVARLRAVVDELAAWRREPVAMPVAPGVPSDDAAAWLLAGAAALVGLLIGGAWERHRNRRDRSLKF